MLGFFLMWIAGLFSYTSFGIDHDLEYPQQQVLTSHIRLRWPGDGSFWMGGAGYLQSTQHHKMEYFDLGGRFFKKPRLPFPRSAANRFGFWLVKNPADDPFAPHNYWSFWLAVPAWLPFICCIGLSMLIDRINPTKNRLI